MREAIGSSLLLNIVIVFVSLVILFFVGIMSYAKAYRVKNKIIEVIENYDMNNATDITATEAINRIDPELQTMGYSSSANRNCSDKTSEGYVLINTSRSSYRYCIYKKSGDNGHYYKVIAYIQFNFPIIGNSITIPVSGETRILDVDYNY